MELEVAVGDRRRRRVLVFPAPTAWVQLARALLPWTPHAAWAWPAWTGRGLGGFGCGLVGVFGRGTSEELGTTSLGAVGHSVGERLGTTRRGLDMTRHDHAMVLAQSGEAWVRTWKVHQLCGVVQIFCDRSELCDVLCHAG
jgi:hypothetical protein